jgi:hypothetical protein
VTDTETDPLQVRQPPAGLTRAERRAWREDEAVRISELSCEGRAVVAATPPRGLGRAGRRVWRKSDRANRAAALHVEAARTESDRYVGALVLLVLLAAVAAWRVLAAGSAPEAAPAPRAPSPVTYQAAPTPTTTAAAAGGPRETVLAWFTAVCPSTPEDPQSARLARSAGLMTPAAWAAIDHTPTPAGSAWSCSNVTVTMGPATTGQAVAAYSADVITGQGTQTVRATRTVEQQPDGTWLVGPLAAAG